MRGRHTRGWRAGRRPLLAVLALLTPAMAEGDVCMYEVPPYMGGFANSLAFFNSLVTFALTRDIPMRALLPRLDINAPAHRDLGRLFEGIMTGGSPPYQGTLKQLRQEGLAIFSGISCDKRTLSSAAGREALRCYKERWAAKLIAEGNLRRCPLDLMTWTHNGQGGLLRDAGFLALVQGLKGAPYRAPNASDPRHVFHGCAVLVVLSGEAAFFHYDFSVSRRYLHGLYHARYGKSRPSHVDKLLARKGGGNPALQVSLHFRLGDVYAGLKRAKFETKHGFDVAASKLLSPMYVPFALLLLRQALPNMSCARLHLFTDARDEDHPAMKALEKELRAQALPLLAFHGLKVNARLAFDSMAYSDVLFVGTSGFGRLAAVMSDGVVVAPDADSHPLGNLDHVIEIAGLERRMLWNSSRSELTFAEVQALAEGNSSPAVVRARQRLAWDLRAYVQVRRPELQTPCGLGEGGAAGARRLPAAQQRPRREGRGAARGVWV